MQKFAAKSSVLATLFVLLCVATRVEADVMTFITPAGSTAGDQSVDATVTLTTSRDEVILTIDNLLSNPRSDIQAINGISFSLSGGQTASSILKSSATLRDITGTGSGQYVDSGPSTTNWIDHQAGLGVEITSIGIPHAPYTLIGDPNSSTNAYSNAKGSITNGVHDPFLAGTATFDLSVPGVTSETTITALQFEFGTSTGTNVAGQFTPAAAVPEPSSLVLALSGTTMAMLGWVRKRGWRTTPQDH